MYTTPFSCFYDSPSGSLYIRYKFGLGLRVGEGPLTTRSGPCCRCIKLTKRRVDCPPGVEETRLLAAPIHLTPTAGGSGRPRARGNARCVPRPQHQHDERDARGKKPEPNFCRHEFFRIPCTLVCVTFVTADTNIVQSQAVLSAHPTWTVNIKRVRRLLCKVVSTPENKLADAASRHDALIEEEIEDWCLITKPDVAAQASVPKTAVMSSRRSDSRRGRT